MRAGRAGEHKRRRRRGEPWPQWAARWLLGGLVFGAPFSWSALHAEVSAPLDDTYIHLMYARSLADGHAFAYHAGDLASSGASSLLWVALLAPFEWIGLDADAMVTVAIVLGSALLGLGAGAVVRTVSATEGRTAAIGGGLVLLGWGWLGWHGSSGMEVGLASAAIGLTFLTLRAYLRAPASRRPRLTPPIIALALALPWIRPEASAFSFVIGLALLLRAPRPGLRPRLLALIPWLGVAGVPLFWWVVTGSSRSNGSRAKWVLIHPYISPEVLWTGTELRLQFLWDFLRGVSDTEYARGFFPPWLFVALLPLALVPLLARRRARLSGALLLLATALTLGALLTLGTFHGHRYRYVVPYLLPLVCLAGAGLTGVVARLARRLHPWAQRLLVPVAPLAVAIAFAVVSWPTAVAHYARSCEEVRRQHLAAAGLIRELPAGTVIGINDAGALAYLGLHRTHDLVGLTTNDAALPYLLGRGSVHEALESLPARRRPTHFAVHPLWFSNRYLLGARLARLTVPHPLAIVGGQVMEIREARTQMLGRGELPLIEALHSPIDSVDFADAAEEEAHDVALEGRVWTDGRLTQHRGPTGAVWEGGWSVRQRLDFTLRGAPGQPLRVVLRTSGYARDLELEADGVPLASPRPAVERGWRELVFVVPPERSRSSHRFTLSRAGRVPVSIYHAWSFAGVDAQADP